MHNETNWFKLAKEICHPDIPYEIDERTLKSLFTCLTNDVRVAVMTGPLSELEERLNATIEKYHVLIREKMRVAK